MRIKKIMSIFVISLMLLVGLKPNASAATTYYQTSKADVPIWSAASSSSTKKRTIATTGTVLKVTGSTVNSAGNLWYKLSDGTWVYSGNVKKHTHSYNEGGICKGIACGYEWPYTITSISGTYQVTNTSGGKVWSRPYSNNSTNTKTLAYKATVSVTGKTTNMPGNLWYRISGGGWIYSGNVKQRFNVTYNANGGSNAPGTQYALKDTTINLSSSKPTRSQYIFKGWATSAGGSVVYPSGVSVKITKNLNLYAVWSKCSHSYDAGYCKTCGYEYPISVTSLSAKFVVTATDGAKVWSRPYSNKSTHVRTEKKNAIVSVVGKTTNAHNNVWYKLSDGKWVYSGNVKQQLTLKYNANGGKNAPGNQTVVSGISFKTSSTKPTRVGYNFKGWATSASSTTISYKPSTFYTINKNMTLYAVWSKCSHATYDGGICKSCKYEYPLSPSNYSGTFVVTNDNGAPVWSRPYSNQSKKVKTYDKNKSLKVVAKVTNITSTGKKGNLWYKLDDGTYVYSGNVTQQYRVKYDANGGKNPPANQYFLAGKSVKITSSKPTRVGYIFKGWGKADDSIFVAYEAGDKYSKEKNLTLYAMWKKCSHKYNDSGICKTCKYEYKLSLDTSSKNSYVVVDSDGATIRNKPYSVSGSSVRKAKYLEVLSVSGHVSNAHGNKWYKLSDGNWIYSERIKVGYKVTYNVNGGTNKPANSGFVSGKLTISSKIPQRVGYVFMGWATSSTATKATYKAGDTYSVKKNITLYAVWSKCTHDYKNNYGICKTCKNEYSYVVTSFGNTVYAINNKNGATTYKRPYAKTSEQVKTYKNKNFILVVGKTTNANGGVWYKLKDGSWIDDDYIKKYDTYNTIGDIPHKYATVMIGNSNDGGLYFTEKVSGVYYYEFFNDDYKFFVARNAFKGTSKNSQLNSVNKNLTKAVNNRTSDQRNFVYHTKKTKTVKKLSYGCDFNNLETHEHIIWDITTLNAKAGISGSDGLHVKCTNNNKTVTIEYCLDSNAIEHKYAHTSSIYPTFTISTTPYASNNEAVGWFTDFDLEGKGLKPKNFTISDYVDLFSCAVKDLSSLAKFVVNPTPKGAFDALKGYWKFTSDVNSLTKSVKYESEGVNELTYIDQSSGIAYRTYKIAITSPINLRSAKDYLFASVRLYHLHQDQSISVKLEF